METRDRGWVPCPRWNLVMGLGVLLVAAAAGSDGRLARAQPSKAKPGQAVVDCVAVRTEAAFASVGYDHLVHLTSKCKQRVACSVRTNVNPEPANVELAPGEKRTVVMWRGSPAREFTVDVSCLER